MCDVEIVLSKRPFQSFIVLVGQRIPWWLKLWVGLLGGFIGNVQFRRPPQDWEEKAFDRFMGLVYSSTVRGFGPDKICWKPARNRGFEVRGYYSSFYPPNLISFPWRMIWQSKVPPRVAFFSWSASLGKILTTDNLRKSCVIVFD